MADTNQNTRGQFLDDDPFAELTRIMGHDPRPTSSTNSTAANPVAASEDDFGIDLEKELLGELDFAEFDEPSVSVEPEPVVAAQAEPQAYQPQIQPEMRAEPVFDTPAVEAEPEVLLDEDLDDALARELMATAEFDDEEYEPASAYAAPAAEAPIYQEPVVSYSAPVVEDYAPAVEDLPLAEEFDDLLADFGSDPSDFTLEEELTVELHDEPVADHSAPSIELAADHSDAALFDALSAELDASSDDFTAAPQEQVEAASIDEIDFDFGTLDISVSEEGETSAWNPEPFAEIREPELAVTDAVHAEASPIFPDHSASLHIAPAEPTLEDELNALLAGGEAHADPVEAVHSNWQPSVSTFGHASFSDLDDAEPVAEAPAFDASAEHDDLAHIFTDDFSFDLDEEPVRAREETYAPLTDYEQAPAPTMIPVSEPDFDSIFNEADFAVDETPAQSGPDYAAAAAAGIAAAGVTAAAASSWSSRPAAQPIEAPDIETVDVHEAARPLVDDLDIPDVTYEAQPQAANPYEHLDGEFAQAFDDMQDAEVTSEPIPYEPVATAAAATSQADYAAEEARWLAAPPLSDNFNYNYGIERSLGASAPYDDDEPADQQPAPRNRGRMIAAAVAGVAALGVVGVVGASLFGGGSDTPVLIQADSEPLKVRPENPGGATVPNQNSQAYQRVGGAAPDGTPGQERLITTAEEPVDVIAQAENEAALAPGINDVGAGEDEGLTAGDGSDDLAAVMGQPKAEDRIAPSTQGVSTASDEVAAVAPRRVRTMIVRPDGTLVPREEPAPVVEAPVTAPTATQAPLSGTPLVETAAPLQADEGGIDVETPATVSVIPTPRVEPRGSQQAAAQVQPVAPAPAPQAPVAAPAPTPVSAPAAAAPAGESGWSMQIASQPTAEGAQTAYQDLARRYGSVLEGRGVNIVRADIDGRGTYFRVRIPASSRDEAIQLCTRFKAAGGSCFVSR